MARHRGVVRRHRLLRTLTSLALVFLTLPFLAVAPAAAVTIGGFEIDGNREAGGQGLDWSSAQVQPQPASTDPIDHDPSVYGQGSKEELAAGWENTGSQQPPGKSNLGDIYTWSRVDDGQIWAYFGFERASSDGTTFYSVELNQLGNMTNGQGMSVPKRSTGDVLFSVEQQGNGDFAFLGGYTWDGDSWRPTIAAADVPGAVSDDGLFLEMALNLTEMLGIEPGCPPTLDFSTLNVRTRSSNSITSSLKDYVAPAAFPAPETCGSLEIRKLDEDDNPVGGATFTLTPNPLTGEGSLVVVDGGQNDPDGSADGVVGFDDVAVPGIYKVTETAPPPGYIGTTKAQSKTLPVDGAISFTFHNGLGSVAFAKIDASTEGPVCCATFVLTKTAGEPAQDPRTVVDNGSFDADPDPGKVLVEDLTTGQYRLEETAPPVGYGLPVDPVRTFEVSAQAVDVAIAKPFADPRLPVDLAVQKRDADTGTLIDTAWFLLWEETNGVAGLQKGSDTAVDPPGEVATSGGTYTWQDLDWATYYVEETQAPVGYALPDTPVQRVELGRAHAGETVTVDFDDPRIPTDVVVKKRDAQTNASLAGATFQLWRDVDNDDALDPSVDSRIGASKVTGADGTARFESLTFGEYLVEEAAAPVGYVLPDPHPVKAFSITRASAGTTVTLTFRDARLLTDLTVQKLDATDGRLVDTARFLLWEETNGVDGLQKDSDTPVDPPGEVATSGGRYTWHALDWGTYYVEETQAPAGYELPDTPVQSVSITAQNAGKAQTVKFHDPRKVTDVSVLKTDLVDGSPLAGATFRLWADVNDNDAIDSADTPVGQPVTSGGDGLARFADVDFGSYLVEETAAPTGYELPADPVQDFDITADNAGTTIQLVFSDPRTGTDVVVKKIDETNGDALAGASFQLWIDVNDNDAVDGEDTAVGDPVTSGADGLVEFADLDFGTYLVEETHAPTGYDLPTDPVQDFDITADNAGTTINLVFVDPRKPTDVRVLKTDAVDGSPLAGASFQLWADANDNNELDSGDTTIGTVETTGDDGLAWFENLGFGSYLVEETQAPTGYDLPADPVQDFDISATTAGAGIELVYADPRKPTDVRVLKTDAVDGSPLAGASFQLWVDVNDNDAVDGEDTAVGDPVTSGADGLVEFADLDFGSYLVEETQAPTGYDLPTDPVLDFDIVADNAGTTIELVFADPRIPGSIVVEKRDATSGDLIDTAMFQLWKESGETSGLQPDEDVPVGDPVATKSGFHLWPDLAWGSYHVEETQAPVGYDLPQVTVQTVVLDRDNAGTTQSVEFEDPRKLTDLVAEKRDADTEKRLAGAEFQLWSDEDADGVLDPEVDTVIGDPQVSGDNGRTTWQNLDFGYYLVEETAAPADYRLPDPAPVQAVVVTVENAGVTQTVTFRDPPLGELGIVKAAFEVDPATGRLVPSDGVVSFGDTVLYRMTVTATGAKVHHDVVVSDYVPGNDPDDELSTQQADYLVGSAACAGAGSCEIGFDEDAELLSWGLGTLEGGQSRTVEFAVELLVPDGATYTGGVYEALVVNVAAVQSDKQPPVDSNEVTTTAEVERPAVPPAPVPPAPVPPAPVPPAPVPPAPVPPETPLAEAGAPDGLFGLVALGLGALLAGAGLTAWSRRRGERTG